MKLETSEVTCPRCKGAFLNSKVEHIPDGSVDLEQVGIQALDARPGLVQ